MNIIWLNPIKYPRCQKTKPFLWSTLRDNFCVVSIKKELTFDSPIHELHISVAADTNAMVYINGDLVINNVLKAPDDFYKPNRYVFEKYLTEKTIRFKHKVSDVHIYAEVHLGPTRFYDFSCGYGGFYLKGKTTSDSKDIVFETDESWLIKLEKSWKNATTFDDLNDNLTDYEPATITPRKWKIFPATLSTTVEEELYKDQLVFTVDGRETKEFIRDFPRIYSAYLELEVENSGRVDINLQTLELDNETGNMNFSFSKSRRMRLLDLFSVGKLKIAIKNNSDDKAILKIRLKHSHYPYPVYKEITTSNDRLNDLFDKCLYACKNCSQMIFLDSPKHCEPLASCAGDYHIESLVMSFATGDYELSKHVLRGFNIHLLNSKGRVANLTYSLLFIKWLYRIYEFTGDKDLLKDCLPGVQQIMKLYQTFITENGLIEPYRYAFVDWLNVDGINLFDPPKSLGQGVSNMLYFEALNNVSRIYVALEDHKNAVKFVNKAKKLKKHILVNLFDEKEGLFIEGLTTPTLPKYNPFKYVSENTTKVYIRWHSNILAVSTGLVNKKQGREILDKLFKNMPDVVVQPYFQHFLFEAVHRVDLDGRYFMTVMKQWLKNVKKSDKGLPEGFFKPSPTYIFDYSHAWASSPYYSFIISSSNLKILEPGMKKVSLKIKSFRLSSYSYYIGTPYGFIHVQKEKGLKPVVASPKDIEVLLIN